MERPSHLVVDQLKKLGVKYVVSLPDNWIKELLDIISQDGDFVHVPVCREDEGVGICAGLHLAGKEAVLLIQNSGLLLCGNALRSLAHKYSIPIFLLISNRGSLEEAAHYHIAIGQGLVTAPLLEALGIPHIEVGRPEEIDRIMEGYRFCRFSGKPVAVLLGKRALLAEEELATAPPK